MSIIKDDKDDDIRPSSPTDKDDYIPPLSSTTKDNCLYPYVSLEEAFNVLSIGPGHQAP